MSTERDPGPLYVLAGGQATGKSTLRPHLVRFARGPVVMEMDELLENGALLGVQVGGPEGEAVWPAYDRMWLRIVHMVRRAGHSVILLCPTPSPDAFDTGDLLDPPVHWALLDCSERTRRARLRGRGWSDVQVEDFLSDPGHARIRALIPTAFHTDDTDPEALAIEVLDWVNKRGDAGRIR